MNIVLLFLLGFANSNSSVDGPYINKITPQPYDNSYQILLQAETIDTRIPTTLSASDYSGSRFIVKFQSDSEKNSLLATSNLTIEGYIPNYAYLVTANKHTIKNLLSSGRITWASQYKPEWKLSPYIYSEPYPETLHVWLFDDADVSNAIRLVEKSGGTVTKSHDGSNKLLWILIDRDLLNDIASLDCVRWIEPFHAPQFLNDKAQWVLQSWQKDNRSLWDKGLDGTGVIGSTGDGGINTNHVMFKDSTVNITTWGDFPNHRKIIAYKPSATGADFGDSRQAANFHGTHTAGTVCGNDAYWNGTSAYDGIAINSKLYFIDVGNSSGEIAYPSDYNDMYAMPWEGNDAGRASFMSNSWGTRSPKRSYDLACRQTDEFVWNHPNFLILFAAGNDGLGGVGTPSTAKNLVCVGATSNGVAANVATGFSSVGPTDDGRQKPAVVAPGQNIYSAHGGTPDGYRSESGTSMATPATAGATALIVQYLREGYYPTGIKNLADSVEPSAALLKAMLITSTIVDFSAISIPDTKVGWGRVCLDSVLYFKGEDNRLYFHDNNLGIETGDEAIYYLDLKDNDWPLRATLVWSDAPAEMSAAKKIVNDLDLEAKSPSGKVYRGNVFSANYSEDGGTADNTNVEEALRIKSPEKGIWTIRVIGKNIPKGYQPYALVLTGMLSTKPLPKSISGGVRIDDAKASTPNNALDPEESATLYPRIINTNQTTGTNIWLKLISGCDNLTINTNEWVDYGTLDSAGWAEGSGFKVFLSKDALPNTPINITGLLKVNGGTRLDTIKFSPIVGKVGINNTNNLNNTLCLSTNSLYIGKSSIQLELPETQQVSLELFDVTGRRVSILADKLLNAGTYSFALDKSLASGIYFIKLTGEKQTVSVKFIKIAE